MIIVITQEFYASCAASNYKVSFTTVQSRCLGGIQSTSHLDWIVAHMCNIGQFLTSLRSAVFFLNYSKK